MVERLLATVTPRVLSPECGYALDAAGLVADALENQERGAVRIEGPPGSGKTTTLQHLAAVLPHGWQIRFLDDPAWSDCMSAAAKQRVVYATEHTDRRTERDVASFVLAPWTEDELIEYLMAKRADQCASVMTRLAAAPDRGLPGGCPQLWCWVLDHMAANENLLTTRQALTEMAYEALSNPTTLAAAERWALAQLMFVRPNMRELPLLDWPRLRTLLRQRPILILVAANALVKQLHEPAWPDLERRWPHDLVEEVTLAVGQDERVLKRLRMCLAGGTAIWGVQPMAASLLHAARTGWTPKSSPMNLHGAYLARAEWRGVKLTGADLVGADLSGADLQEAALEGAELRRARLDGARMHGASLRGVRAMAADLRGADLSHVRAAKGQFDLASLEGANLEGALLDGATFCRARLTNARLVRAALAGARLTDCALEGTNFSGANLDGADLNAADLRATNLRGATLVGASLDGCILEGAHIPAANLERADLTGALLTGAYMPDACLRKACLQAVRAADVNWERADLTSADLRSINFHMGSSRSGLVGSAVPMEGSMTGYYTDDYEEQHFKAPEEIRKANLRGADLRGANIDDVDFYLVDLRDAHYDPAQEKHLRACGAILRNRA